MRQVAHYPITPHTGALRRASVWGRNSMVGIATHYRLNSLGMKSWWRRDFPHLSRPALGLTQPPVEWVTGSFPGVKSGRGVTLNPHPLLVPWS